MVDVTKELSMNNKEQTLTLSETNTLIAVAIAPFGVGDELATYVARAVEAIQKSGLPYKTTSMFTEIEGPWDEVMETVKRATAALVEEGIRTEVILKADIRPGYENTMEGKVEKLNAALSHQASRGEHDHLPE